MAEWSKALVLGTSLLGGVGSNPTAALVAFIIVNIKEMPHFQSAFSKWPIDNKLMTRPFKEPC